MGTKLIRHDLDFGSAVRPINLPDPSASHHPATRGWVENALLGLNAPIGVKAHSAVNVDISQLNNGDSLGGATVATDDLVYLTGQTTAAEDGVYKVGATAGTTVRFTGLPVGEDARGLLVAIEGGTDANKLAIQTANPAIIGTNGLTVTLLEVGGTSYTFSQGTQESGGTVTARLDGGSLAQSASGLKVATDGVTTTELANLAVATANIADDAVTEDKIDTGVVARWKTFTGPATAGPTWTQAHGMGKSTLNVQVQFNTTGSTWRDVNDGLIVEVDATNVVVDFGASVSDRSTYRIVLVG